MKTARASFSLVLIALMPAVCALAQANHPLAENAALRYWAAFSEIQDSGITDAQAKELNAILDGTAPYDELKYKELLEKNTPALETMARGASISSCDWGLDYGLGPDTPVDYARKALVLGRLNVLYAFHLFKRNRKDDAVRALAAGLKFSRDVGNGGSFFATLIAKDLLANHLRAIVGALQLEKLSPTQKARLRQAAAGVGGGLDWASAARWEMEALRVHFAGNTQASAALPRIGSAYVAALNDPAKLPALSDAMASAPQEVASLIPSAARVLEQRQDLINALQRTQALLQ